MNPTQPPATGSVQITPSLPSAGAAAVVIHIHTYSPATVQATDTANLPNEAALPPNLPPTTEAHPPAPAPALAVGPAAPPGVTAPSPAPAAPSPSTQTAEPATSAKPAAAQAGAPTPKPTAAGVTAAPPASIFQRWKRWWIAAIVLVVIAAGGWYVWKMLHPAGPGEGFISGNGRIEATEIGVAAKLGGRVQDILVNEGDFVAAGQTLAHMQVQTLEAQRDEASARHEESITGVASALAQVAMRSSDRQAAQAVVAQHQSELDAAQRRLARSETLTREGAASQQELDDDRARVATTKATVLASEAQVAAAQAAIGAAQAEVLGARSTVNANMATIARIKADIDDSALTAPRAGRVQYRIAQPGEVLAAGGKVLNLLDTGDVYMTFFVPETIAGRLALGSEVHIVLDAAPKVVIPSTVSFVASSAQFTPKTVETASERQKLMFRVKAQIGRELLQKHVQQVKTGLPGVAWIKLDAKAPWPAELAAKVPD